MIDWTALLRLGLSYLRLSPDAFWHLTPMELGLMAGIDPKDPAALGRDWLNALCESFPDKE